MESRHAMMVRFTFDDLERAHDEWSANCGPGSLAAICGLTLDEVRPHFGSNWPGYTNPTTMRRALGSIGVRHYETMRQWPRWGLCRIQWEGPWTQPGVPMRVRYLYTHWVGSGPLYTMSGEPIDGETCIWDVNTLDIGNGWAPLAAWIRSTVPALTRDIPGATGGWHITHAIEVSR